MAYKMKGIKNFGEGTPLFNKKGKKYKNSEGDQQGPIPKQNIKLQDVENPHTWVYSRGYKDDDPKKGLNEMESDRKTINKAKHNRVPYRSAGSGDEFVESERIYDYESRKAAIDEDAFSSGKKLTKKQIEAKKNLEREAEIMRDRSKNRSGKKSYYTN